MDNEDFGKNNRPFQRYIPSCYGRYQKYIPSLYLKENRNKTRDKGETPLNNLSVINDMAYNFVNQVAQV